MYQGAFFQEELERIIKKHLCIQILFSDRLRKAFYEELRDLVFHLQIDGRMSKWWLDNK